MPHALVNMRMDTAVLVGAVDQDLLFPSPERSVNTIPKTKANVKDEQCWFAQRFSIHMLDGVACCDCV